MALDLFAGIRVSDYEAARSWYERLLGAEPSFIPHATEAVWELAALARCSSCVGRDVTQHPQRS
ncbi:MAG: VOC family protein, partial [Actinobacteria bacterium]|nr:VOC family protein [Actinomycetota bacterium]